MRTIPENQLRTCFWSTRSKKLAKRVALSTRICLGETQSLNHLPGRSLILLLIIHLSDRECRARRRRGGPLRSMAGE